MARSATPKDTAAWHPARAAREHSQLAKFLRSCGLDSFKALHRRSIEDIAWFTGQVLNFLGVQFDRPYRQILDLSRGVPWPRWCVGGGLNITRTCLDRHLEAGRAAAPAVVWESEEGASRMWTYAQLHSAVEQCAAGLRAIGLRQGDTVGIHLPMMPESVAALLAAARMGAVAVPLFSGFGPGAIETRLRDVGAKVLFTCDAFPRRGLIVPAKANADEAVEHCPEVTQVVVVRRLGIEVPMCAGRDITWEYLMELGERAESAARRPEATEAEAPLMVLYSSGTTGQPKGILHSHCGFPVKAAQDMTLGTDVGPGDRITWITDIGWMMGPWLIYGATILGATMVLYDGAPDFPDQERLWAFCAANRVEILGIAPTLARSQSALDCEPRAAHDLAALRILASTGEPWNPDPWWWLFEKVGAGKLPIINYSGGTEISGGILMGHPLAPLKPCSFPDPCPGMDADVVDDEGRAVRGAVGELVIRQPWIGMARGFWNDPDRYVQTYWSRWSGVWQHGDWARIDGDGHWYILGRSDDTMKVAGKRIGPAEIESVLVSHPGILEAAVVGVPDELKGCVPVAFCVTANGNEAEEGLGNDLKELVAKQLGKPLRPEMVLFVPALPRTRNAKIMRRVILSAWLDRDPGDIASLENPGAVEAIRRAGRQAVTGKE
jgi:acetyl-CoA synthetase